MEQFLRYKQIYDEKLPLVKIRKNKLFRHNPEARHAHHSQPLYMIKIKIMIMVIIMLMLMIMSVFYSANFNSDKSPCSKRLWYQTDTRQKLGKYTQYDRNVTSQLWICDIEQMCLHTALENGNGLGTLDGDRERIPERRSSMRKTTLAKTFQAITRCHREMFTLRS